MKKYIRYSFLCLFFASMSMIVCSQNITDNLKLNGINKAVLSAPKLDHASWSVKSVGSEQNAARLSIDDDPKTFWQASSTVAFPHEIVYDLGIIADLYGITYLPRQDANSNNNIVHYSIFVSENPTKWGKAVKKGTFTYSEGSEKTVVFPSKVNGRYIRMVIDKSQGSPANDFASCAEFNALGYCTGFPKLSNLLDEKRKLLTATWTAPPTRVIDPSITQGAILGNGDVAVAVGGTTTKQTIYIAKSDFITDMCGERVNSRVPVIHDAAQIALGGLNINVNSTLTTGYKLEQDIFNAELRMQTATNPAVNIRNWVATGKNLVVSEISTQSLTPVSIKLENFTNNNDTAYKWESGVNGKLIWATRQSKRVFNSETAHWVSKAGITSRVLGNTTVTLSNADNTASSDFTIVNGDTIRVLTYVSGGGKGNDAKLAEAADYVNSLDNSKVKELDAINKAWWSEYYKRSLVDAGDNIINRYYYASLYMLGCTYRSTSVACGGLYGNWVTTDQPLWCNDLHLNYNGQAPFYGVFSANRPETVLPFLKAIDDYIPQGRINAQTKMGKVNASLALKVCRGILYPVSLGNWGEAPSGDQFLGQTVNAPFSVPLYLWYYQYTLDKRFLKDRAYPYIKEVGDFYEDYLEKEQVGNSYRYTLTTCAHEEHVRGLNPASDIGFVSMVFKSLLSLSDTLKVDEDRRALWKDILTHLSPVATTVIDGKKMFSLNEKTGWVFTGSNFTINQSIHPCEHIDLLSPPDSLELAKNTLRVYESKQDVWYANQNNFPMLYPQAARMGFSPDTTIANFKKYCVNKTAPNFVVYDGWHGMEKAGAIEMVNSMFLQSVRGTLLLFPSWPTKKNATFYNLRAKGAFLVSADYLNSTVCNLNIYSEKGTKCSVRNPWGTQKLRVLETLDGVTRIITPDVVNEIYSFPTISGANYTFEFDDTNNLRSFRKKRGV